MFAKRTELNEPFYAALRERSTTIPDTNSVPPKIEQSEHASHGGRTSSEANSLQLSPEGAAPARSGSRAEQRQDLALEVW
jgi:hypothetical protein